MSSMSYSEYLGRNRCCDLRGQGPEGAMGPTGPAAIGPRGVTGPTGMPGPVGVQGNLPGDYIYWGANNAWNAASAKIRQGGYAGYNNQGDNAISIGYQAGTTSQGASAVAIGYQAGSNTQGAYSIAVGHQAASTSQNANSILLNASGASINPATTGFFVNPIRNVGTSNALYYNSTTSEITFSSSSRNVKHSIEDFTQDTSTLYFLSPKTYVYNEDTLEIPQLGYVAEEVFDIDRNFAITEVKDGPPTNIHWNAITVYLVEEVKQLRLQNQQLLERVAALESKL